MIRSWGRSALVAACMAAFASGAAFAADAPAAAPAPVASPASIPVADFFRHPAMTAPRLSPSGRYVAVLAPVASTGYRGLMILDLVEPTKSHMAAFFDDADIDTAHWLNEDTLFLSLSNHRAEVSFSDIQANFRVYTVERDGSRLPQPLGIPHASRAHSYTVLGYPQDGSGDMLLAETVWTNLGEVDNVVPWRYELSKHAMHRLVEAPPPHVIGWGVDARGEVKAAEAIEDDKVRLYVRSGATGAWKVVNTSTMVDGLSIEGVGTGNTLYVAARLKGEDTASLVAFDTTKTVDESPALVSVKGYDFTGQLELSADDRLVGVHYLSDARGTVWFDPVMKKAQARVDQLLPSTINEISCHQCGVDKRVVVTSFNDHQPAVYRIYDLEKDALIDIGTSRPWINPRQMASSEVMSVTARDGLKIPVTVTRPRGPKKPAPAIVLVHGGPFVRGNEWRWSPEAQFFASRGYAVIEPEYRGSTGYGFQHFKAGWKQWGLAMQDDVADVTRWAAAQGIADPARICIAGASYGGYATLMGLVRDGDLYRCGVEWVGVTDLDLLHDLSESDMSEQYRRFGFPVLVGDPKADAQQFAQTSPVRQASRIHKPVLMAYGKNDHRVPIEHGFEMRDALVKNGVDVTWIAYEGEGHGWYLDKNNEDFYTRVQAFLDQHLKGPQDAR